MRIPQPFFKKGIPGYIKWQNEFLTVADYCGWHHPVTQKLHVDNSCHQQWDEFSSETGMNISFELNHPQENAMEEGSFHTVPFYDIAKKYTDSLPYKPNDYLEFQYDSLLGHLSFRELHKTKQNQLYDYLLRSSLCYVEAYSPTLGVVRYLATKSNSVFTATIPWLCKHQQKKGKLFFQDRENTTLEELQKGILKIIRLDVKGDGLRVSRGSLNTKTLLSVTPLYIVHNYVQTIVQVLTATPCRVTYMKDGMQETVRIQWSGSELMNAGKETDEETVEAEPSQISTEQLLASALRILRLNEILPLLQIVSIEPELEFEQPQS